MARVDDHCDIETVSHSVRQLFVYFLVDGALIDEVQHVDAIAHLPEPLKQVFPMRQTSLTHPLRIAAVTAGEGFGRIGITFCPGKYDRHAMSGFWDRDLSRDLDTVRDWGAAAVVTLLEPEELVKLRVERIGEEAARRNMEWYHLSIADFSIPDDSFEQRWLEAGAALRSMLRQRFDVLVHCKGGLGRAGMIAARLLVELGMEPASAIASVRAQRLGAIETTEQEKFILGLARL